MIGLDVDGLGSAAAEARAKDTSFLFASAKDIEDYDVRALLDVDVKAMKRNAELVVKLWDQTKHC